MIFSEPNRNGGGIVIYRNICRLAKKEGLSINKLEQEAGLSSGSICKWGNSVSPTVRSVKAVADILGVTVDDLLTDTQRGE